MAGRTAQLDIAEGVQAPDAVLAVTRQFLAELHPGAAWIRPVKLDSALERDLGLDSLSRVELAVRIERAFGSTCLSKRWAARLPSAICSRPCGTHRGSLRKRQMLFCPRAGPSPLRPSRSTLQPSSRHSIGTLASTRIECISSSSATAHAVSRCRIEAKHPVACSLEPPKRH